MRVSDPLGRRAAPGHPPVRMVLKVAKAAEKAVRMQNAGAMAAAATPVGVSPAFLKYTEILPLVGNGVSLFPQTGLAADDATLRGGRDHLVTE